MAKASTQQFLEMDQIREGVMVLKNKALRGILMVSSLNFALKSDDEQTAIIYQFQNFLNSLDFSIQIVVQSRRLNITGYLDELKELEANQENELLKLQIGDYRKFVKDLIKGAPPAGKWGEIMTKNFFVVVPFSLVEAKKEKGGGIFKKPKFSGSLSENEFQRCKNQLWQRMEFVALGLRRCGLQAIPLKTSEIIELFWSLHHPEESEIGYYPELPPEIIH